MKLVLKRRSEGADEYALHTEDGEILPGQARITVSQEVGDLTRIKAEFVVDDDSVWIQGSKIYGACRVKDSGEK